MAVPLKRHIAYSLLLASSAAICAPLPAHADEIRLKDGKKLYGVIVAYEDNMFKVRTDFGFVLVEKDKIAAIIPEAPKPATPIKTDPATKPRPGSRSEDSPEKISSTASAPTTTAASATVKPAPVPPSFSDPVPLRIRGGSSPKTIAAPKIALAAGAKPAISLASASAQPAKPLPVEPPQNREDVQGNIYTNYTHKFRMYKPPSWQLIDDARKNLPNAIVAMGTANESTLMVVGQEKTKEPLEPAALAVEGRLRDIYQNYRRISQRKTVLAGLPAVEVHYHGLADDHDWSGTLVIVARGNEIFTVLGMTYSASDLIQIQENVIARAISSLEFNSN